MNFPKPTLDRDEAMETWLSEHSEYAKEQVVLNNIGLIGITLKSMNQNLFDEDLFATGLVGLVKSINTFIPDKEIAFSTYAIQVIKNEILLLFRRKRINPTFSLDELCTLKNGEEIPYKYMIQDYKIFEEEILTDMQFNHFFENLDKREKEIMLLKMKGKTQKEIGELFGVGQAQISRIIKKVCKKYKEESF